MQVCYTKLRKKVRLFAKQIIAAVGLLALPITLPLEKVADAQPIAPIQPLQPVSPDDPRTDRLKNFLDRLHCPIAALADEFVNAADDNQLDWRLLPSISLVESGGGKSFRNNNIFGWNNGLQLFPTVRTGIHEVAYKLGKSALYRNRDVVGKLRLYNPDASYVARVLAVMHRISPVADLKPASHLIRQNDEFVYAD